MFKTPKNKRPEPAAILNAMTCEVFAAGTIACETERAERFDEIERRYTKELPAGAARRLVNIARNGTR